MTQQMLMLTPPEPKKPHKVVRQTSRAVYAVGRETFTGRKANVLRHLAAWWNRFQYSPTSAELANWAALDAKDATTALMTIRRGLSDLKACGVVECVPDGKRLCYVTDIVAETWRVREVGSKESV